jgi:hypothetical protein
MRAADMDIAAGSYVASGASCCSRSHSWAGFSVDETTEQVIQKRVELIRGMATREIVVPSDGYAFAHEYELWKLTLQAIATGAFNPEKLASEALKTLQIEFDRFFS